MTKKNTRGTGFLYEKEIAEQSESDYLLGATPIKGIAENIETAKYLPIGEIQRTTKGDMMDCFPYDAEVLMEDFSYKKISHIKVGEYVFAHTGEKQKVLTTMKRPLESNQREFSHIKIKGINEEIVCTPEHPVNTMRGWIKAKDLELRDFVIVPTLCEQVKDLTIKEVEKDNDFLWLLGFYLAEGSLAPKNKPKSDDLKLKVNGDGFGDSTIHFNIHAKETHFHEKIKEICAKWDINVNWNVKSNGTSARSYMSSVWLKNLLEELGGRTSLLKKLHPRLMFLDPDKQMYILRGWLDGDGWTNIDKRRIGGVSISKTLVEQMQRICFRNKIKASITTKEAYDIHKEAYTLHIYGQYCHKVNSDFSENDGYKVKKEFNNLDLVLQVESVDVFKENSIKQVYNIEVEEDNSYIVKNVSVHNCATRAPLNILETKFNYLSKNKDQLSSEDYKWLDNNGYITEDGSVELSDAYTAILSGTTTRGNSLKAPLQAIHKYGVIPKSRLPLESWMSWWDYHNKARITPLIKELGAEFLKRFPISYEKVMKEDFGNVIPWDMLDVAGYAWSRPRNGIYPRINATPNHAFAYFKTPAYIIFDNYIDSFDGDFIKHLASDYNLLHYGYRVILNQVGEVKKKMEKEQLEKLYKLGLKREIDDGAKDYLNHDTEFVINELLKSEEHKSIDKLVKFVRSLGFSLGKGR